MSGDHAIQLQPGDKREILPQKKKKKILEGVIQILCSSHWAVGPFSDETLKFRKALISLCGADILFILILLLSDILATITFPMINYAEVNIFKH